MKERTREREKGAVKEELVRLLQTSLLKVHAPSNSSLLPTTNVAQTAMVGGTALDASVGIALRCQVLSGV